MQLPGYVPVVATGSLPTACLVGKYRHLTVVKR